MTQVQATAIIFLLAAILFVLLAGPHAAITLFWVAVGAVIMVVIVRLILRR